MSDVYLSGLPEGVVPLRWRSASQPLVEGEFVLGEEGKLYRHGEGLLVGLAVGWQAEFLPHQNYSIALRYVDVEITIRLKVHNTADIAFVKDLVKRFPGCPEIEVRGDGE
jgi:hypothetical protein